MGDEAAEKRSLSDLHNDSRKLWTNKHKSKRNLCVIHTDGKEYCKAANSAEVETEERRLKESAADFWSVMGVKYAMPAPTRPLDGNRRKNPHAIQISNARKAGRR